MDKELKENINTIRQTGKNRYRIILDFATIKLVSFLLSHDYKYVLVYNQNLSTSKNWKKLNLPLIDDEKNINVLSKNLRSDLIIKTDQFLKILPNWDNGIQLIQMNNLPPSYFDPNKIQGNQRYKILQEECDFLFDLEIPSATDYGTLISSNRSYLEGLLNSEVINWNNLP